MSNKINIGNTIKVGNANNVVDETGKVKLTESKKSGGESSFEVPLPAGHAGGSVQGQKAGEECDTCVAAFISQIPGSRIYIGTDIQINGCPSDGFITMAPVGTPRTNPLKTSELIYPFGIALITDPEVAEKLRQSVKCGNVPYREFDPETDGELSCFLPAEMTCED